MVDKQRLIHISSEGDNWQRQELALEIAEHGDSSDMMLSEAFEVPVVRRWAREFLLPELDHQRGSDLARHLLQWSDDFQPDRRDVSTKNVITSLDDAELDANVAFIAGSNAASSLWQRISDRGASAVMQAVAEILQRGDERARETTLHLLVLDPYGPEYLSHELQDQVLTMALDDPDSEIRGLAAEVLAAEKPELLLERWSTAPLDSSERLRMAFWRVALVHSSEDGIEAAGKLALEPEQPHSARRTALIALGEHAPTRDVSPVLQALLRGKDEVLASDAAQLMWRYHRTPDIANAAADSQFSGVANLAQRLLHPELGSPAAGGSRPGDPTKTTELFEQMIPPEDRRDQDQ
jgi:hypothetical protein